AGPAEGGPPGIGGGGRYAGLADVGPGRRPGYEVTKVDTGVRLRVSDPEQQIAAVLADLTVVAVEGGAVGRDVRTGLAAGAAVPDDDPGPRMAVRILVDDRVSAVAADRVDHRAVVGVFRWPDGGQRELFLGHPGRSVRDPLGRMRSRGR